jgi:hypothetical protein
MAILIHVSVVSRRRQPIVSHGEHTMITFGCRLRKASAGGVNAGK